MHTQQGLRRENGVHPLFKQPGHRHPTLSKALLPTPSIFRAVEAWVTKQASFLQEYLASQLLGRRSLVTKNRTCPV